MFRFAPHKYFLLINNDEEEVVEDEEEVEVEVSNVSYVHDGNKFYQQTQSRSKGTSLHVGVCVRGLRHVVGQLLQPVLRSANRLSQDTQSCQDVRNDD